VIAKGARVRILINAGLVEHPGDSKFSGNAKAGTLGTYVGPHPSMCEEGWHLVSVDGLLAPLGEEQFEAVAS
jgi:hypothetical protein